MPRSQWLPWDGGPVWGRVVRSRSVDARLDLRLVVPGGTAVPVRALVRFHGDDPYAVHVRFHTGSADPVAWTFARQLLTDGVRARVGEGDVQVWPSPRDGEGAGDGDRTVFLSLRSPSGSALFEVGLGALVEFLTRTYTVVPTGAESDHIDIDRELSLLWGPEER